MGQGLIGGWGRSMLELAESCGHCPVLLEEIPETCVLFHCVSGMIGFSLHVSVLSER